MNHATVDRARRGVVVALAIAAVLAAHPRATRAQQQSPKTFTIPRNERTYKLFAPPGAEKKKNLPLVVYLHPSGGPMLTEFQRDYLPVLTKRGCVVAVPLSKDKRQWAVRSDTYIRSVITDVGARYSIDAKRIVLLGISAGGQVALFLADRTPKQFRAVVVVSTNPVVIRGGKGVWFYPDRRTLKKCSYFVVCHITHGASLKFWRQVRAKLAPAGASISIIPVLGKPAHYQPPPKQLRLWLGAVLSGKQPAPIEDPQKLAVAKAFAGPAKKLFEALKDAKPAKITSRIKKRTRQFELTVGLQDGFERSKREASTDAAGRAITQIRTESKGMKRPIYVRVDARAHDKPMSEVLAAETEQTRLRGMLYQVYHAGPLTAAGRKWRIEIGSITFPDKRKGWRTTLFLQAAAHVAKDKTRWVEITVMDETQEPDPKKLATVFRTLLTSLDVKAK